MAKRTIDLVHYGPNTPAGRYLRHFWHPVARSADLKAGWTQRLEILGEFFTLYRGESGKAFVVGDKCPHRRTRLSVGEVDGDCIRCFYHGWKFSGDGLCVEQPPEPQAFKREVTIRAYPVREYLGLVFAYLGEGEPPEFQEFPEAEYDNGYPLRVMRTELNFNFLQRLENSLDEAHVHFVHGLSANQTDEFSVLPEAYEAEETEYGILRRTIRDRDGKKDRRQKYFMMPNIGLTSPPPATSLDTWVAQLSWRVPKNDETTISFVLARRKPRGKTMDEKVWQPADEIVEAILAGRMRMKDVDPYHPRLFNIQDNVAMGGQGRLYDDRNQERLGRSDTAVVLLRRIYEREIQAVVDGKPIKRWRYPKEKLVLGFHPTKAAE